MLVHMFCRRMGEQLNRGCMQYVATHLGHVTEQLCEWQIQLSISLSSLITYVFAIALHPFAARWHKEEILVDY